VQLRTAIKHYVCVPVIRLGTKYTQAATFSSTLSLTLASYLKQISTRVLMEHKTTSTKHGSQTTKKPFCIWSTS